MENAYVSYMANDRDIKGVLLLNYNLKKIGTKYKYYVIIIEGVSNVVRNILKINNISIIDIHFREVLLKYINDDDLINDIIAKHYYGKYLIFSLTQFDKIVYLDTDLLLMDNIDHLIELETEEKNCCPTIYMVYDMMVSFRDDKKLLVFVNNEFNSGVIIYKPSAKFADLLFSELTSLGRDGFKLLYTDQDIFNNLYKNGRLNIVPLHPKYNISPYLVNDLIKGNYIDKPVIVHYMLKPKPWDLLDNSIEPVLMVNATALHLYKLWINLYFEMINKTYLEIPHNDSTFYADEYYMGMRVENHNLVTSDKPFLELKK